VKLAAFLMLLAGAAGAVLALSHDLTQPRIARQLANEKQSALASVLPRATAFSDQTAATAAVRRRAEFADVREVWAGSAGGRDVGRAYLVAPVGYGGPVETLVGVAAGGRIVAVRVVSASRETPGLGLLVKEPVFLGQFSGQPPDVRFSVVTRRPGAPAEVQAVTGATISSRAVVQAANTALELEAALGGAQAAGAAGAAGTAGAGAADATRAAGGGGG